MANRPFRGSDQTLQSLAEPARSPARSSAEATPLPSSAEASGARDALSGERVDATASVDAAPGIDCLSPELIEAVLAGALEHAERMQSYEHLATCRGCVQRLSRAGDAIFGGGSLAPGSLVARRYLIIRFVAQGGMGEVYEAYDTELSVRVALKMVPTAGEQKPAALRALTREVLLARSIAHPNVCRIFDLGLHDGGLHTGPLRFLTMEFVDGDRLSELIASGPLQLPLARSIAHDLLLGLAAAHRAGVLHRDFKSDNVLLREGAGGSLQVVIMDFGLARSLGQQSSRWSSANHRVEGSLYYMAPEQLLAQPLGWETDLYGFGVVLFEMLTGRTPFEHQLTLGLAMQRCEGPAPRPSAIVPGLSPALDRLVQRCLDPQRAERYPSAEAALAALDEAFSPPATAAWSERIWGRAPMLLGFLTLAGLGVEADQVSSPLQQAELTLTPTPPVASVVERDTLPAVAPPALAATLPPAPVPELAQAEPAEPVHDAPAVSMPAVRPRALPAAEPNQRARAATPAPAALAAPVPAAPVPAAEEPPTLPSASEAPPPVEANGARDRRDTLLDPFEP
jgi:serine/threonine protein kinase